MRIILFLFLLSQTTLIMGQTFEDKLSKVFLDLPIFDSHEKVMEASGLEFTPFYTGSIGHKVSSFVGDFGSYEYLDIKSSMTKLMVAEEVHFQSTSYSVAFMFLLDDPNYANDCYWNLLSMFEAYAWKVHTRTKVNAKEETISEMTWMYFDKRGERQLSISIEDSDPPAPVGKKAVTIKFQHKKQ